MPAMSRLLKAMRFVVHHHEGEERTQLERNCRQWFIEDFKGFMAKYADVQKVYDARVAKEKEREQQRKKASNTVQEDGYDPEEDHGLRRLRELHEKWLQGLEEEYGETCPQCGQTFREKKQEREQAKQAGGAAAPILDEDEASRRRRKLWEKWLKVHGEAAKCCDTCGQLIGESREAAAQLDEELREVRELSGA